jgi:hypothetical protein
MGKGNEERLLVADSGFSLFRSSTGGRLSGIDLTFLSPFKAAWDT